MGWSKNYSFLIGYVLYQESESVIFFLLPQIGHLTSITLPIPVGVIIISEFPTGKPLKVSFPALIRQILCFSQNFLYLFSSLSLRIIWNILIFFFALNAYLQEYSLIEKVLTIIAYKVIDNIPFEQELILLKVDLKKIRKGKKGTVFFDDPSYMFGIFFLRISVYH